MQKVKWLILVVFLSVLTSCVTQRRCNIRFPAERDTIRIETIRDSIVFKDTIIYIHLPGEKVIDSFSIPCPDVPGYVPKRVYAETQLAKASAWWSFPNIKLELTQKDTTIVKKLDKAIKELYYWKTLYEKVHITPEPVKYIPKIYKDALSICIFIFALAFAFMGWKLYRFFKK